MITSCTFVFKAEAHVLLYQLKLHVHGVLLERAFLQIQSQVNFGCGTTSLCVQHGSAMIVEFCAGRT